MWLHPRDGNVAVGGDSGRPSTVGACPVDAGVAATVTVKEALELGSGHPL